MYRIDTSTASASPPSVPAAGTEKYFQDTEAAGGTVVPAWWLTMVQEELRNVIVDNGLTPDKNDNGQLSEALDVLEARAKSYGLQHSGSTVFTGAPPTTYDTLDLSGVVGANRCMVYLSIIGTAGSAAYVRVRPNGDTNERAFDSSSPAGTTATDLANGNTANLIVLTDTYGFIEWVSSSGLTGIDIVLDAYQIVQ